jgi:hypothetical protein
MDGMGIAKKVKRFMMQFLNKRNQKHLNEIVWMVFVLVVKVVVTTGYNLKKRIKVMANENAFKIIDVEDAIARYKLGYISDSEALVLIQAAVSK